MIHYVITEPACILYVFETFKITGEALKSGVTVVCFDGGKHGFYSRRGKILCAAENCKTTAELQAGRQADARPVSGTVLGPEMSQ